MVAQSSKVFQAMLGDKKDFLKPIVKIQPNLICLGFDQKTFPLTELKTNLKKRNLSPQIIRLKSFQPQKFKSSLLRKKWLFSYEFFEWLGKIFGEMDSPALSPF